MTRLYTMTNGEEVTYKELQIVAGDFGIKKNQKAEVLIALIGEAVKPVEEVTTMNCVKCGEELHGVSDNMETGVCVNCEVQEVDARIQQVETNIPSTNLLWGDEEVIGYKAEDVFASLTVKKEAEEEYMAHLEEFVATPDEEDEELEEMVLEQQAKLQEEIAKEIEQEEASEASEPKASEQSNQQQPKAFEFVSANQYGVRFMQRGELIRVGWNIQDGKSYIVKGNNAPSFTMLDDVINKLKAAAPLTIETQEIGRIINALLKVKSNYKVVRQAVIKRRNAEAQQQKAENENVSRSSSKENGKQAKRGTVDPRWLAAYKEAFANKHDRQPNGKEIQQGWEIRLAKINA